MPNYNYPSKYREKRGMGLKIEQTAFLHEIKTGKKNMNIDWGRLAFISIMTVAVAIIIFDNFILPTWGI